MLEEPMVWTEDGREMTPIRRNPAGRSSGQIHEWCAKHLTGEVCVSPRYVWFEYSIEATFFAIGFDGY